MQQETGNVVEIRFAYNVSPDTAEKIQTIKDIGGLSIPDVFAYSSNDNYGTGFTDGNGICFNHTGTEQDIATVAHEAGHNMEEIKAAGIRALESMGDNGERVLAQYKAYRSTRVTSKDKADIRTDLTMDMYGCWHFLAFSHKKRPLT